MRRGNSLLFPYWLLEKTEQQIIGLKFCGDSGALHSALHVLRINLLPRYIHLFRFLSLHLTLPWARLIDTGIRNWLASQLDSPASHAILAAPVAHAGLGLTTLQYEAPLHCLFGHLALTAGGACPATAREQASCDLAVAEIMRLSGLYVWECTRHLLPHRRAGQQEFLLRIQRRMLEANPFPTPPELHPGNCQVGCLVPFSVPRFHVLVYRLGPPPTP